MNLVHYNHRFAVNDRFQLISVSAYSLIVEQQKIFSASFKEDCPFFYILDSYHISPVPSVVVRNTTATV